MFRSPKCRFTWTLLACGVSAVAVATTLDERLDALAGGDEQARATARQMLPREGVEAVPRLVALLAHEDQAVWNAARNVLSDVANEVCVPGREDDRAFVTDCLMTLLDAEQPLEIKQRGLRLLPVVIPEGYSVRPMAVLLGDPELREKARAALEKTGTREAARALCKALRKADPDFQYALLNSLGRIEDPGSIRSVRAMTRDDNPRVRAAAVRALAWTGDPDHLEAARAVRAAAEADTEFEAADALIRLTDAVARQGGDRCACTAVYREILETASLPALQAAAIVGLVRYGHGTVAGDVLAALEGDNGRELEASALAAFQNLDDPAAYPLLLEVYSDASPGMRPAMLGILGRKQDARFLPLLQDAAASDDAPLRHAALDALGDSRLPEGVDTLAVAAERGDADDKAVAADNLRRLAAAFREDGNRQAAGAAFLGLYRASEAAEARAEALEGIIQCPIPETLDVILGAVDAGDLGDQADAALGSLARTLFEAGRTDEAERALSRLLAHANSTEAVRGLLEMDRVAGGIPDLARRLGVVASWSLVGPFPWESSEGFGRININEPNVDPTAEYEVAGKTLRWHTHATKDPGGMFDLGGLMGGGSNVTAYGLAEIEVPEAVDAVVRVGSDDGVKVWVNGEAVHEHNVDRGAALDDDQAPARLKAGKNTLLVQITQGGGGWGFCLRLTRPDGVPVAFTMAQ